MIKEKPRAEQQLIDCPVVFGEFEHLFGVVTEPETTTQDTAVIFLTAGMLHHVGANRMHVQLARSLAERGYLSFRFDLSGIGESFAVGSNGSSLERARAETISAMDAIEERYGIERFALFGLCSGADDSLFTATNDERVVGTLLIDGCGYPTKKFAMYRVLKHYLPRLIEPKKIQRRLKRMLNMNEQEPASLRLADDVREFPDRDQAARELQMLSDRGVKMRFIYTGGVHQYYNYEEQFAEMFEDVDFKNNISSRYFSSMDHLATLAEDRTELFDDIHHWFETELATAT